MRPARHFFAAGEPFGFQVILFGWAINDLPIFIDIFRRLATEGIGLGRGRSSLVGVSCRAGNRNLPLYDPNTALVLLPPPRLDAAQFAPQGGAVSSITIEFITPMQLMADGEIIRAPEFHHVAKRLRDRISSLAYFFGNCAPDMDFAGLGRRAEDVQRVSCDVQWIDRERESTRSWQKHSLGGFVGHARYEGNIQEFVPLLKMGEWTHVGKHCVWGNGQYRVNA